MSRRVLASIGPIPRVRLCWVLAPLYLLTPGPVAGEPNLDQNGDPSDHPVVWYSAIGMAVRDALREATGQCYQQVGEIVICKKRDSGSYRIPHNLPRSWPPK
jgi:hypothetical protein